MPLPEFCSSKKSDELFLLPEAISSDIGNSFENAFWPEVPCPRFPVPPNPSWRDGYDALKSASRPVSRVATCFSWIYC